MESEVYVYALLFSKMPVMYCMKCAARDHFVLAVRVYLNKTQRKTVLMVANKERCQKAGSFRSRARPA